MFTAGECHLPVGMKLGKGEGAGGVAPVEESTDGVSLVISWATKTEKARYR